MKQKELFYTRQRANEGVRLPLSTPEGEPTEHYIKIRGTDSDAYKLAVAEHRRKIMAAVANPDKTAIDKARVDEEFVLLAALVIEWSFEEPCTPEGVLAFLKEAPQIAEQIDKLSTRRSLFFAKSSPSSTPSLAPSSS